jgi:hypothetical protein
LPAIVRLGASQCQRATAITATLSAHAGLTPCIQARSASPKRRLTLGVTALDVDQQGISLHQIPSPQQIRLRTEAFCVAAVYHNAIREESERIP